MHRTTHEAPIIDAVDPALVRAEVASLPVAQRLSVHGKLAVYFATADQISHTLREIGRLREITFRGASEGTGRPFDLDRFDQDYLHLFACEPATGVVIGAYRMGQTDVLLARRGVEGLYTSTLFDYQYSLLDQISPALELGRSFVRPEYQRSFAPLMMLWKGIGRYVCLHPRYTRLFGPVSINSAYRSISQQLIVTFLRAHEFLADLAKLIRAKNPPMLETLREYPVGAGSVAVSSLDEVDALVSQLESDHKGVPILLKQYMKLGGKLLGFNVDPDFGNVLDGLVLVDLTQTSRRILNRYMGAENASRFLARQIAAV